MARKKIITREIKIGISFIISIMLIIFGINFLKGINIFTPTNHYYLKFEHIDGLVISNGVFIKGYKIGQVRDIQYNFNNDESFIVDIAINDDIILPKGTICYLFDESLMGGKGINIKLNKSDNNYISGDTITTDFEEGLLASMSELVPQLQSTISQADSVLNSANKILNSEQIEGTINDFRITAKNLRTTSNQLQRLSTVQLPKIVTDIESISHNLHYVTGELKQVKYKDIFMSLDSTITNLEKLSNKINSPNGTIGLLLNDKTLYNNLNSTMTSANSLIIDLQSNPKRYVHFSLFGRKEKQKNSNNNK